MSFNLRCSILIAFVLGCAHLHAQEPRFDKKIMQSEDHWIALGKPGDSSFSFGFLYLDAEAGMTFHAGGSFRVVNDRYVPEHPFENTSVKVRMGESRALVAWIPESRFKELGVEPVPSWLSVYKGDTTTAAWLFRRGYLYNEYEEFGIGLNYLLRAQAKDPGFRGLPAEMAFSYNALGKYDAAISVLRSTPDSSHNCYTMKELAFAYQKQNNLEQSEETYRRALQRCDNKTFLAEMAYNLTYSYYVRKDREGVKKWAAEVRRQLTGKMDRRLEQSLARMEDELK